MTTKPIKEKKEPRTLEPFEGFVIYRKGFSTPWSRSVFGDEERSWEYFDQLVKRNNFDFDRADFELVSVWVTLKSSL